MIRKRLYMENIVSSNEFSTIKRKRTFLIVIFIIIFLIVTAVVLALFFTPSPPRYAEDFEEIIDAFDGIAAVRIDYRFTGVVDVETNRVLIAFRNRNNVTYNIHRFSVNEPNTIIVERIRYRWTGSMFNAQGVRRTQNSEWALINFVTGEELIAFSQYHEIYDASNGVAMARERVYVENLKTRVSTRNHGIIDISSGEIIIGFDYRHLMLLGENLFSGFIESTCPWIDDSSENLYKIIDGDVVLVGNFRKIQEFTNTENIVLILQERDIWYFFDTKTQTKMRIPGEYMWIDENFNGFAFVRSRNNWEVVGLVDLVTGEEIIAIGRYDNMRLISNYHVIIFDNSGSITERGVKNFITGYMVIPFGMYDRLLNHVWDMQTNSIYMKVSTGDEVGLIEITNGDIIIPLGAYEDIFLSRCGMIAVLQDGRWRFITSN